MGDNALIVQIFLGLLVIFFFVTIGFSVRTWRFAQLFFLSLTFIGTLTFTIFAAMVLKTHKAWRVEVHKMEADLEVRTKQKDDLQFGDVTHKVDEVSLRDVKADIARILLDRGRTWRGCQPGNFDGMSVTVTTATAAAPPPAVEGAPPAAAPAVKANNIEVKAILYAFKELPNADNTMFVPGPYLGEFVATAVTESSVTLAPTIPLDADQLTQIKANDSTWVLYEVLPVDAHEFFAGLNEEQLRAAIPQGKMPQAAYDAVISSYLRTNGPATDEDPPATRWWRVVFKKKKTIDVDSDQMAMNDVDFFDQQGRAVVQRLRRGEVVEFDLGDTALVDEETANAWVAAGEVAKEGKPVYLRPLNDYVQMFKHFFHQRVQLANKIDLVTRETKSIEDSTKLAEGQVVRGMEEQTKLEEDKTNYTAEQAEVTKLEEALKAQHDQLRQQLSQTFRANQQLAAELAALQKQLADEIAKADASKTASLAK
jgi:hypothetical protein